MIYVGIDVAKDKTMIALSRIGVRFFSSRLLYAIIVPVLTTFMRRFARSRKP